MRYDLVVHCRHRSTVLRLTVGKLWAVHPLEVMEEGVVLLERKKTHDVHDDDREAVNYYCSQTVSAWHHDEEHSEAQTDSDPRTGGDVGGDAVGGRKAHS